MAVHRTSSDIVTAATGGGLYRSADGVSRNGRIEESYDGGQTWHLASDGMMSASWSRHMVERFVQLDNDLFAVLSNGAL